MCERQTVAPFIKAAALNGESEPPDGFLEDSCDWPIPQASVSPGITKDECLTGPGILSQPRGRHR